MARIPLQSIKFPDLLPDYFVPPASEIIESASGAIASFDDGADGFPVKDLLAQIAPQQNLNGYDHPWPAGGGKNLFDGHIYAEGKGINAEGQQIDVYQFNTYSQSLPQGTYTYSIDVYSTESYVRAHAFLNGVWQEQLGWVRIPSNSHGSFTFTVGANCDEVRFSMPAPYYGGKVQVETGSTETSYEPYSNVCPITGWTECNVGVCGKNMFNPSTITNGFLDAYGNISTSTQFQTSDYIKVNEGTTYTSSYYRASEGLYDGMRIAWYDKNKTFIQRDGTNHEGKEVGQKQVSAVAPSGAVFARTSFTYGDGVAEKPQFETGSTATTYEPYNGAVYTVSFASAGTVYGGSLDVTSGVLTVDRGFTKFSNNSWSYNAQRSYFKTESIKTIVKKSGSLSTIPNALCSMFKVTSWNFLVGHADDAFTIDNDGFVQAKLASAGTDVTMFLSLVGNAELCFELATPQTYQLTPTEIKTLLKNNNIWADTGNVAVDYVADLKTYIDNAIAQAG